MASNDYSTSHCLTGSQSKGSTAGRDVLLMKAEAQRRVKQVCKNDDRQTVILYAQRVCDIAMSLRQAQRPRQRVEDKGLR
jgi:hypothetical protein